MIVQFTLAGRSGYGRPERRSRELIGGDIALGAVTLDGAIRDYQYSPHLLELMAAE